MHKLRILLLGLIIFSKINLNGVGFLGISLWFYLILLACILFVFDEFNKRIKFNLHYKKYLMYLLILFFVMIAVLFIYGHLQSKMIFLSQYLVMIILSILVYITIKSEKDIKSITLWIVVSILFSSIFGLLQALNPSMYHRVIEILNIGNDNIEITGRINGLSTTTITFSYELLIGLLLSLWLFQKYKMKIMLPIALIIILTLLINQTRSAIVAAIFSVLLFYFQKMNLKKIVTNFLLIFIAIAIVLSFINLFDINVRSFFGDTSSTARIPMIITAIRYSFYFPFGTGIYDLYKLNIDLSMYSSVVVNSILSNYTHNQFSNILVEYGYLGLLLMILIYVNIFGKHFKSKNIFNYDKIWIIVIIGFTINALSHNTGILSIEPVIWSVFSIFYRHTDLKYQDILLVNGVNS